VRAPTSNSTSGHQLTTPCATVRQKDAAQKKQKADEENRQRRSDLERRLSELRGKPPEDVTSDEPQSKRVCTGVQEHANDFDKHPNYKASPTVPAPASIEVVLTSV
jgi:hypothetical protein